MPTMVFTLEWELSLQLILIAKQQLRGQGYRFGEKMKKLHEFLREEMTYAQAMQEQYANQNRNPAPNYQIGDYVFVDATYLRSDRPSKKLDFKSYGLYPILKRISPYAYQLGLPTESNARQVFPF